MKRQNVGLIDFIFGTFDNAAAFYLYGLDDLATGILCFEIAYLTATSKGYLITPTVTIWR